MKVLRVAALSVAAIGVPAVLAGSIYLISAHSFETPARAVPRLRGNIATPNPQWSPSPAESGNSPSQNSNDISGPCDEAEHRNDPRCSPGSNGEPNEAESEDDDSGQSHENEDTGSSGGDD
jgi:hypothetical protein